jgi:hypothetical protein
MFTMAIVSQDIADASTVIKRSSSAKISKSKANKEKSTKPKRPLSAYNLFFRYEREQILQKASQPSYKPRRSHGKIGFADLARAVAESWKNLEPISKAKFEAKAAEEKVRYERELDLWNEARVAKMTMRCHLQQQTTSPSYTMPLTGAYEPLSFSKDTIAPLDVSSHSSYSYRTPNRMYMSDSSSCGSLSDDDCGEFHLGNNSSQQLRLAATRISNQSPDSFSLFDCTPLPTTSSSSIDTMASSFDAECLDIMATLQMM